MADYKLSSKAKKQPMGQAGGKKDEPKKKEEGFKFYTGEAKAMPIGEKVKIQQIERGGKEGVTLKGEAQKRQQGQFPTIQRKRNKKRVQ